MARHDLEDGFLEGAVSHAYYAMFHASKSILLLKGIVSKTHKGVISSLGEYVKLGELSKEDIRTLAFGLDFRIKCDYDVEVDLDREEVDDFLHSAEKFVEKVEKILVKVEK